MRKQRIEQILLIVHLHISNERVGKKNEKMVFFIVFCWIKKDLDQDNEEHLITGVDQTFVPSKIVFVIIF